MASQESMKGGNFTPGIWKSCKKAIVILTCKIQKHAHRSAFLWSQELYFVPLLLGHVSLFLCTPCDDCCCYGDLENLGGKISSSLYRLVHSVKTFRVSPERDSCPFKPFQRMWLLWAVCMYAFIHFKIITQCVPSSEKPLISCSLGICL